MRSITDKKGQISLADAPNVVMIVGFVFLIMATIAFVGEKYQESFSLDTYSVYNETLTTVNDTLQYSDNIGQCEFQGFAVTYLTNNTDGVIYPATNYTVDASAGSIYFSGGAGDELNGTLANMSYTYQRAGVSCNITSDLNTELSNNTSIAGIVLTISLIGIVLSVLIGVFVMSRRKGL